MNLRRFSAISILLALPQIAPPRQLAAWVEQAEDASKGSRWFGRAGRIKATVKVGNTVSRDHELLAMDALPDISGIARPEN